MQTTTPPFKPNPDAARRVPGRSPAPNTVARRAFDDGSPITQSKSGPRHDRWLQSGHPNVLIKADPSGRILEYRLDRDLRPDDLMTLSQAAAFLGRSTQTLRNWARDNPAFPGKRMGGHWVVIQPYLNAFLLHAIV